MDLVHMRTYVAVVEERGFSAAARRLGIAKSICSRRVAELETELGVQFVRRTTRSVMPTDLGMEYFDHCRDILNRVEEANALASTAAAAVRGNLRIAGPVSFTGSQFEPVFDSFIQRYPLIRLEVHLSDAREDLVSSGFDAGIRVGNLGDSTLVSKRIGETRLIACAAPDYLAAQGVPRHPEELGNHRCLMYTNLASGSVWVFERNGKKIRKRITGQVKSNNGEFLRAMAGRGHGVALLPDFIVGPLIDDGRLVPVFGDYTTATQGVHVVFPERKNLCAMVRAFIDHVSTLSRKS